MTTIQQKFPGVHWIWGGGISFVYEVHPSIVVKVPESGEEERDQFKKELKVYEILSQQPPCPFIVQCFYYTDNGIFLEYMRDVSLSYRIQCNHTRNQETFIVTKVEKLEPLILRKEWMNNLAQAVAFLESLNLAHGDLRPENILLDRDRLKLSDFDNTAELGTDFETCTAPYGRILNADEADQGPPGSSGCLGPRTEQFALGSIFYLINYGFEVYGNQSLGDNPRDHGPKVVDLLQNKQFPNLDGDSMIDNIISKCWHNKYATVAELATEMKTVVPERDTASNTDNETTSVNEAAIQALTSGGDTDDRDTSCSADEFLSKKAFCEDLKKRGLLHMLSSEKPEQLGFTLEWYRYQKQELDSK